MNKNPSVKNSRACQSPPYFLLSLSLTPLLKFPSVVEWTPLRRFLVTVLIVDLSSDLRQVFVPSSSGRVRKAKTTSFQLFHLDRPKGIYDFVFDVLQGSSFYLQRHNVAINCDLVGDLLFSWDPRFSWGSIV
ncbi:hypothetical protein NE237_026750 [Protea cynaroides]|uniref:Uncharacterized protein n=1 Tax=Protea cynaroides TaxID=273540 RepID=A0A9Q0GN01_9MAGN|nr:hypothetical protein NE237_026750 [Protea cynaroides]